MMKVKHNHTLRGTFRGLLFILIAFLTSGISIACAQKTESDESMKNTETKNAKSNHLAGETSPYLLQHAHNPVNWYPWGPEAFALAKKENKPIFLSIGYSACHWCHVMERESFEDPATAEILNKHFIAIKVDREERPDVDEIYMAAVQLMTGSGGWPLSVFLTPDLKPFYGGTYFPKVERYGMPAFQKVLLGIAKVWEEKPDDLAADSERLIQALKARTAAAAPAGSASAPMDKKLLKRATQELAYTFDPDYGGFGRAPKFPPNGAISLLLRQYAETGNQNLLTMATATLDCMAHGGIYDQIGGGFHRYSTDAHWLTPHFEKMLYDNALLAPIYLEAWQLTGKELYRRTAVGIFDYVLRDMTDPAGGFHSSEDADSEGEEGKFYVWTPQEIEKVLGKKDAPFFNEYYHVTAKGNFEGHNILNIGRDHETFLKAHNLAPDALEKRLAPLREKLLKERAKRVRPGKDDKVLAAWNGMMISAFAKGYQVLGDERYRDAAEKAAHFVLTHMMRDDLLLRSYRGVDGKKGESKLPAYLDDYALVANGLVDLYETIFDPKYLDAADAMTQTLIAHFWDKENGAFFYTSADHKNLLLRTKPSHDAAVPSGNSSAAYLLLRLHAFLDKADYRDKADAIFALSAATAANQPRGYLNLLCAVDFQLHPTREIAIVGKENSPETKALLRAIHARYIPRKILALLEPGSPRAKDLQKRIPLLQDKTMLSGKTTVYVCENYTCKQPVTDPQALEKLLEALSPALK